MDQIGDMSGENDTSNVIETCLAQFNKWCAVQESDTQDDRSTHEEDEVEDEEHICHKSLRKTTAFS